MTHGKSIINRNDRSLAHAAHLHDDCGQVILSPALMDYSFQLIGGSLGIFVFSQNPRDLLVGQVAVDAVAAQEKTRTLSSVDGFYLDIYAAFDAKRPIDDVAAGKFGSLIASNSTSPNLVVQISVINSLAVEPPVFQAVDSAVADVGYRRRAPVEMDQRYCRRHCLEGRIVFGHLEDIAVGEVDGAAYNVD